jgi:hypothetical protein
LSYEIANDMLKVPIPVPLLHSIVTINLLKEKTCFLDCI